MIRPLVLSLSLLAIVGCQNKEAPAAATDATAPEAAATQTAEAAPATGPEITPANPPAEPAAAVLDAQPGPKGSTWELTKVATVGQIMTRQVRVASAHRPLMELVPLFSEDGHHHIPIIDAESRLVGIITQSDLVRALYRAVRVDG